MLVSARDFLSDDAKHKMWLLCPCLLPRALQETPGWWKGLIMMWGQGKWQANIGTDIYKQHPCHLFKSTFHSLHSKTIVDGLGESVVIGLSGRGCALPHPLEGSIKEAGNGKRSRTCDGCHLTLLFMKFFWKGPWYRQTRNKVNKRSPAFRGLLASALFVNLLGLSEVAREILDRV